jgi:Peptidase family C54
MQLQVTLEFRIHIQNLFSIKYFKGIVAGVGTAAFYLIGATEGTVLYLDPHLARLYTT